MAELTIEVSEEILEELDRMAFDFDQTRSDIAIFALSTFLGLGLPDSMKQSTSSTSNQRTFDE